MDKNPESINQSAPKEVKPRKMPDPKTAKKLGGTAIRGVKGDRS